MYVQNTFMKSKNKLAYFEQEAILIVPTMVAIQLEHTSSNILSALSDIY